MTAAVEFRTVGFIYHRLASRVERAAARPTFALHDISFDIQPGEILGVIGPNSAGKTTLIRLLTKVLSPTAGTILLEGRPLLGIPSRTMAQHVAVVPQDLPQSFPFTVAQLVLMGRYPHGAGRLFESDDDLAIARDAMAATGVLDMASAPLESVSGGERQRAVIARALAQRPRLLILDEPTAHLDLRYQAECAALLHRLPREHGVTVMLVSHDLNLAADLCDRLLLLAKGRVVQLGPPDVVLDEAVLASAFDCAVTVEETAVGRRVFVSKEVMRKTPA